ncbi:MAG TPA: hypothetical protein VIK86_08465 [Candidatus Paceibacterota bacterium]
MNKKIKNVGTGAGIAGITIAASTNVIPGIGGCTGSCGACGLTCLAPILGISSILFFSIVGKRLKLKAGKMIIKFNGHAK